MLRAFVQASGPLERMNAWNAGCQWFAHGSVGQVIMTGFPYGTMTRDIVINSLRASTGVRYHAGAVWFHFEPGLFKAVQAP